MVEYAKGIPQPTVWRIHRPNGGYIDVRATWCVMSANGIITFRDAVGNQLVLVEALTGRLLAYNRSSPDVRILADVDSTSQFE